MATHYCRECTSSTALGAGARFCGNCGLVAAVDPALPSAPVAENQTCPQCGQADRVAKVSGIVAAEFRREEYKWYDSDHDRRSRTVVTSTPLASQLKLPEPYKKRPFASMAGIAIVSVMIVLFFTFVISTLADFISMQFLNLDHLDFQLENQIQRTIFFSAVAVEAIMAIVSYGVRIPKLRRKLVAESRIWSQLKPAWDKLYYCYRDDVVFSGGRSAPSSRMIEFLSEERGL
jgi:hypothetical protein